MQLSIEAAQVADVPKLADVWCRAQQARTRGTYPLTPADLETVTLRRIRDTPGSSVLIARADGVVAGMGAAMPAREDDGEGAVIPRLLHVSMIAVDPPYWRRGIATRILRELLSEAVDAAFEQAQLWTQLSNSPAIALYGGLGFRPSGRTKDDHNGEAIVHFTLTLNRSV